MTITAQQVNDLCESHCYRVLDDMGPDNVRFLACQAMINKFCDDEDSIDLEKLVKDIYDIELEDKDSTIKFITNVVGNETLEEILKEVQF
jgi:hypothetical protein